MTQKVANSPLGSFSVNAAVDSSGVQTQIITTGFSLRDYDYVAVTYPSATSEVYVFKQNGVSGTTIGTITLVYTDSTKASLSSAART